jgi:uncharacterized protein (DUF4415 family)
MTKEYDFSNGKRGPVIHQQGKSRITLYLDNDVLDEFRERADNSGSGYQTMINEALREYLNKKQEPINEAVLRKVVREELEKVALH